MVRTRLTRLMVVLTSLAALALSVAPARSRTLAQAVPVATPPSPPATCSGTGCGPPPCSPRVADPAFPAGAVMAYRARNGVTIHLQPIPSYDPITSMAVHGNAVAWSVVAYLAPHERFGRRSRLYLSSVTPPFHPVLIGRGTTCTDEFDDVHLSARWLVWVHHLAITSPHPVTRIWALDRQSGRRLQVNDLPHPGQQVTDVGPISLDGDTVTWSRGSVHTGGRYFTASIVSRRLPDGAYTYLVTNTVRLHDNGRFPTTPYVEGHVHPVLAGHTLVWTRSRWNGHRNVSDVLLKDLSTGRARELWHYNGDNASTNGATVAWQVQSNDQNATLMRYSLRNGSRAVLSTHLDNHSPAADGPRMSDGLLVWRTSTIPPRGPGSIYQILARDLASGRDYRLASGTDDYGGSGVPYTLLNGPFDASGKRAVWQQTSYDRQGSRSNYLAIADVP